MEWADAYERSVFRYYVELLENSNWGRFEDTTNSKQVAAPPPPVVTRAATPTAQPRVTARRTSLKFTTETTTTSSSLSASSSGEQERGSDAAGNDAENRQGKVPVRCIFCAGPIKFDYYNNDNVNQPRYKCLQCKNKFNPYGKLRGHRQKMCKYSPF